MRWWSLVVALLLPCLAAGEPVLLFSGGKGGESVRQLLEEGLSPVFNVVFCDDLAPCAGAPSAAACLNRLGAQKKISLGVRGWFEKGKVHLAAVDLFSGKLILSEDLKRGELQGANAFAKKLAILRERAVEPFPGVWFLRLPGQGPPRYIQCDEVSQRLWSRFMGYNPSHFVECGDLCPVENVSRGGIDLFLAHVNQLKKGRFRLPTPEEWQRARGLWAEKEKGFQAPCVSYGGYPCDTWPENETGCLFCGTVPPEGGGLGLRHMAGNVKEWVQGGHWGFLAGGSWAEMASSALWQAVPSAGFSSDDAGFRMVFEPEQMY